MRHQRSLFVLWAQTWLLIGLLFLLNLASTQGAENTTSSQLPPPEDKWYDNRYIQLAFSAVLGGILIPIIRRLAQIPRARCKRRQKLKTNPFHWRVIIRLGLSPAWIKQLDTGDGAVLGHFIENLPIKVSVSLPGHPADTPVQLNRLLQRHDWMRSRQARQLADLIAESLKRSNHITLISMSPMNGKFFDIKTLQKATTRTAIEQEIVTTLRNSDLRSSIMPLTPQDLLRERYRLLARQRGPYEERVTPAYYAPTTSTDAHWHSIDIHDDRPTLVTLRSQTAWAGHFAEMWANESLPWLSDYDYLLWVPLKAWFESSPSTTDDLLQSLWRCSLGDASYEGDCPPLSETLLVLDGYDEVAQSTYPSEAFKALQLLLTPGTPHAAPHVMVTTHVQMPLSAAPPRTSDLEHALKMIALQDRMRHYYQTPGFLGGPDPFKLEESQTLQSYYQPLELDTRATEQADHHRPDWTPIDLSALMDDRANTVILTGVVGVGKTTWSRRLAQDWAKGSSTPWLNHYDYLLYIPLRDWLSRFPTLGDEYTQDHLLRELWRSGLGDDAYLGYCPLLSQTLLILDGYDEVAQADPTSPFAQAMKMLLTPDSSHVIITTRPQVALSDHFDGFTNKARRCRITGFSPEHQKTFIRDYFADRPHPDDLGLLRDRFPSILERHAVLRQIQYNPLLLKMLCWLYYDEANTPRGESLFEQPFLRLTPIYRAATTNLQRRVIRRLGYEAIPDQFEAVLKKLANQSETVITSQRVSEVFAHLEIPPAQRERLLDFLSVELGLLQPLRHNPDRLLCHWQFLHRSFQEYYRALAISDQLLTASDDDREALVKEVMGSFRSSELVFFLVGELSTHSEAKAIAALQDLIHSISESSKRSDSFSFLVDHCWRVLSEILPERHDHLRVPTPEQQKKLDGFIGAARAGSVAMCQWLIKPLPESRRLEAMLQKDGLGETAFYKAASRGHKDLCLWLIQKVPEPQRHEIFLQKYTRGETAFHRAAAEGHKDLCLVLVRLVPESQRLEVILQKNSLGETVLHIAAIRELKDLCLGLIQQAPEPQRLEAMLQKDRLGETVFHRAASEGHKDFCLGLIQQVPESQRLEVILQKSNIGVTAFHQAAAEGHKDLCVWLIQQIPEPQRLEVILQKINRGETAFHRAASEGHKDLCLWLIQKVPEPQRLEVILQKNSYGKTAFHHAALNGQKDLYIWLIRQVPKPQRLEIILQKNTFGQTVLHIAAIRGLKDLCLWLIQQVPESQRLEFILQKNNIGETAFHAAISRGYKDLCVWLIQQVPEPQRLEVILLKNNIGETAFHAAVSGGYKDLCVWLIQQVPEPQRLEVILQKNIFRGTAFHQAASHGHKDLCLWLIQQVPEPQRLEIMLQQNNRDEAVLHVAAIRGLKDLCVWLIQQVPEPQRLEIMLQKNSYGEAAFHKAASGRHKNLYLVLVRLVPESQRLEVILQKNCLGETALHLAAFRGLKDLCLGLIQQVPEPQRLEVILQKNSRGETACYKAASQGHKDLCVWLIQQIPEPQRLEVILQKNDRGETAFRAAVSGGYKDLCMWWIQQVPKPQRLEVILQKDIFGRTAFHQAASEGHKDFCVWLVEYVPPKKRSDFIALKDDSGGSALDYLSESQSRAILALVPSSGSSSSEDDSGTSEPTVPSGGEVARSVAASMPSPAHVHRPVGSAALGGTDGGVRVAAPDGDVHGGLEESKGEGTAATGADATSRGSPRA